MECFIHGPSWYTTDIDGESGVQAQLETICGGRSTYSAKYRTQATLVVGAAPEIAVEIDGVRVGVLPAERSRSLRDQLKRAGFADATPVCDVMIVGGWRREGGYVGKFGVKLDLPPAESDLDIVEGPPQWPDGSRKLPRRRPK